MANIDNKSIEVSLLNYDSVIRNISTFDNVRTNERALLKTHLQS